MHICYGNCQARNISEELIRAGHNSIYRHIQTTYASLNVGCNVDKNFQDIVSAENLGFFFGDDTVHEINVLVHPTLIGPDDVLIVNTFHEPHYWDFYRNMGNGYVMSVQKACLKRSVALAAHVKAEYAPIVPDSTYMYRFSSFVGEIVGRAPETPCLIVVRATPGPAYAPDPYSYLMDHDVRWKSLKRVLGRLQDEHPKLRLVFLDNMVGAFLASHPGATVDDVFNRFRVEDAQTLRLRRDIEHFSTAFLSFLVERLDESIPDEAADFLTRPYQAPSGGDDLIEKNLSAGETFSLGLFLCFLSGSDKSDLVIRNATASPICQYTLHLLKWYSRLHPNRNWKRLAASQYEKLLRYDPTKSFFLKTYKEKLDAFARQ